MNLAAHPDDEDGLTLAYARGHDHDAAVSVVFTRGEGGQNEIGPDLYERLGAIRTGETEAAARVLGSHVLFLNLYDFGFSKHAAEAFDEWSRPRTRLLGHGRADARAPRPGARPSRRASSSRSAATGPTVLFTNHDTLTAWPDAQHGQHQAVGISALDAFRLAADPAYHPEQLALPGVRLWQPARLFVRQRAGRPGRSRPCPSATGATRRRARARPRRAQTAPSPRPSLHASQGFATFAPQFRADTTYFELYASAPGAAAAPAARDEPARRPRRPRPRPSCRSRRASTWAHVRRSRVSRPSPPKPSPASASASRGRPGRARCTCRPASPAGPSRRSTSRPAAARSSSPPRTRPTVPRHVRMYDRTESTPPLTYTVDGRRRRDRRRGLRARRGVAAHRARPRGRARSASSPGANEIPVAVRVYDATIDSVLVTVTVSDAAPRAGRVHRRAAPRPARARSSPPSRCPPTPRRARTASRPRSARSPAAARRGSASERPAAVLPDVAVAPRPARRARPLVRRHDRARARARWARR